MTAAKHARLLTNRYDHILAEAIIGRFPTVAYALWTFVHVEKSARAVTRAMAVIEPGVLGALDMH